MIEHNRVTRIIFGLAFAAAFAVFAYISCRVSVHSSDFEGPIDPSFGYNRQHFLDSGRGVPPIQSTVDIEDIIPSSGATGDLSEAEYTAMLEEYVADEMGLDLEEIKAEEAREAARPEVQRAKEKGLPSPPDIDITEWQYSLVNFNHRLDSSYAPEQLAYVNMTGEDTDIRTDYDGNRQVVDIRIAQALVDFAQGCRNAGLPVYLSSGYRSYSTQYDSYQNKISQYNQDVARFIVAEPGTSEHQTGMCCDITDIYRNPKDKSLANTNTFKWLEANCADYGFILRYPESKSGDSDDLYNASKSITEVIYEPWHFRYVGVEAAKYIMENNLCLEEFWELYVPGTIPAEKLA